MVVVADPQPRWAHEMRWCVQALAAELAPAARWLQGFSLADALALGAIDDPPNPAAPVLCLQHPWVHLAPSTLRLLRDALASSGADVAQACDTHLSAPMRPPDYATLRGMDRYARSHPQGAWETVVRMQMSAHTTPQDTVATGDAQRPAMPLLQLTTWAALPRWAAGTATAVRVQGAFAHDASGYFAGDRAEVLPLIPPGVGHVLDVGGGEGGFLAAVQAARPGICTVLVEADAQAAARASGRGLTRVVQSDFMQLQASQLADVAPHGFDVVSFLDVIEHLTEPEAALRQACTLLAPGGCIVASVPNVGHWSVVADLLEGSWDYAAAGIHCITHLRFFTRRTLHDLLQRAGLVVQAEQATTVPMPADWLDAVRRAPWQGLATDESSLNTYAWHVRAVPAQ
jgi:2-polyprenyl-3-methyl-5-hydroxy-6-metoxy-1,4-benzoquinol methylase